MTEPRRTIKDCEVAQRSCRKSRLKVLLVSVVALVSVTCLVIAWGVQTGERVKAVEVKTETLGGEVIGLRQDIKSGFEKVLQKLDE